MAILTILEFPDPQLRTVAKAVDEINTVIHQLVDDMLETMYLADGIGLAATQINVHQRVVVIDVSDNHDEPLVFINPEIEILDKTPYQHREGCLSVPGYYEEVSRPESIKVTALNKEGSAFITEPDGLLAVCLQHEVDHLNGKLFVDHISALKRNRIKQKLQKDRRLT